VRYAPNLKEPDWMSRMKFEEAYEEMRRAVDRRGGEERGELTGPSPWFIPCSTRYNWSSPRLFFLVE
jgi:hypothetical protein